MVGRTEKNLIVYGATFVVLANAVLIVNAKIPFAKAGIPSEGPVYAGNHPLMCVVLGPRFEVCPVVGRNALGVRHPAIFGPLCVACTML
jgi:hypothetical protein